MFSQYWKGATILSFILMVYFPVFLHLDVLPVQLWDESLYAVNAIEMAGNHEYIVKYFNGQPDMWNLKPPFVIWLQVICMKLFGYNELAIRLPGAILAALQALLLLWVSHTIFRNLRTGWYAGLLLVTATGYVSVHGIRTGDTDGPLSFWMFVYSWCFFQFMQDGKTSKVLAIGFGLGLVLAGLTKGVMGLMFLPGLAIYGFSDKEMRSRLFSPLLLLSGITGVGLIAGYYLLREQLNPGYLFAVWQNELGGRLTGQIEDHTGPWYFYLINLITLRGTTIAIFLVPGWLLLWASNGLQRQLARFSLIICFSYLGIISVSATKLEWYDMPLYPWLALVGAVTISWIIQELAVKIAGSGKKFSQGLLLLFTILLLSLIYIPTVQRLYKPKTQFVNEKFPFLMKKIHELHPELNQYTIVIDEFNAPALFYSKAFNASYHTDISVTEIQNLHIMPDEYVMLYSGKVLDEIHKTFNTVWIDGYQEIMMFQIAKADTISPVLEP